MAGGSIFIYVTQFIPTINTWTQLICIKKYFEYSDDRKPSLGLLFLFVVITLKYYDGKINCFSCFLRGTKCILL